MAITNNGTQNKISEAQLPTGYTRPTVTIFTDFKYQRQVNLSVLKATVQNADPAVTMANIIANGTIGVTKQVTDILAADYLGTATVTAYADIVALENNFQSMLAGTPALTDTAASYIATVNIYVKTT
jgi:hypothetical protein